MDNGIYYNIIIIIIVLLFLLLLLWLLFMNMKYSVVQRYYCEKLYKT